MTDVLVVFHESKKVGAGFNRGLTMTTEAGIGPDKAKQGLPSLELSPIKAEQGLPRL